MELKEIALEVARHYLKFKLGDRKGLDIYDLDVDEEDYLPLIADIEKECAKSFMDFLAAVDAERGKDATAWVRFTSDGGYEGPIMDSDKRISDTRRKLWSPLFLSPTIPEGMALVPIEPTDKALAEAWLDASGKLNKATLWNLLKNYTKAAGVAK